MDILSLYRNIPQEERINIVCNAYTALSRKWASYPYANVTTAKSAQTYLSGELHLMEKPTYKYMELKSRAPTETCSVWNDSLHDIYSHGYPG